MPAGQKRKIEEKAQMVAIKKARTTRNETAKGFHPGAEKEAHHLKHGNRNFYSDPTRAGKPGYHHLKPGGFPGPELVRVLKYRQAASSQPGSGGYIKVTRHSFNQAQIKVSPCFPIDGHAPSERGRKQTLRVKFCPAVRPEGQAGQINCGVREAADCSSAPGLSAGFSLVETLIAMAILFFLLVGAAQMLCYSLLLKQKADLHQLSADLISRKIEVLKSLEPENEALSPGLHQETVQDKDSGRYFFLTWEVMEEERLKKVRLSLYPAPFGSRPPLRVSWYLSETLGF